MMHWGKLAPFAALSLSMALTAAGCVAPGNDDGTDDLAAKATRSADDTSAAPAADPQNDEAVGEANQTFVGVFDHFFLRRFFPFCGCCGFPFGFFNFSCGCFI